MLRTKANVFDATMQGRRSFTFEYEGTYRNPRFYDAKVVYSVKMIHAPRVPTVGSTGYQMYQTTSAEGINVASKHGPIIAEQKPMYLMQRCKAEEASHLSMKAHTETPDFMMQKWYIQLK